MWMWTLYMQNPKWRPSNLADVDIAEVESVFDPLPHENELNVW